MIAFGPPHDPDSLEGREYAAIAANIKAINRERAGMRAESQRMDAEMQKVIDGIGNPAVATLGLLMACAIPGVLMLAAFYLLTR